MDVPDYWLPRPAATTSAALGARFDQVLDKALADGPGQPIDYQLDAPKWQFLCHAADRGDYVLHGSANPDIAEFEPRQPHDLSVFGAQLAVFAAADGIWPMFYAILDRDGTPMSMCNACVRIGDDVRYYFSISASALARQPWQVGTVYLLPSATFVHEPPANGFQSAQTASPQPVRPAAKLTVGPQDFPYLDHIHGHDDAELTARATADPDGFPWHYPK